MKHIIPLLRALAPSGLTSLSGELSLAERQASHLLRLLDVDTPLVPEQIITDLPNVRVRDARHGEGSCNVSRAYGRWVIPIDASEPLVWRRWALMHQFKHVLDYPSRQARRQQLGLELASQRGEHAAEAFAASVLMPRTWVELLWSEDVREVGFLARTFEVSFDTMRLRLEQLGLVPERTQHVPGGVA